MARKAAALKAFQASDPDLPQLAIPPTILEGVEGVEVVQEDSRDLEGRGEVEGLRLPIRGSATSTHTHTMLVSSAERTKAR